MSGERFQLTRVSGQPVTDTEILTDLKAVASKLDSPTVSMPQYKQHGKYDETNISRRFGSWNQALVAAGLPLSNEINISDQRLFENILILWQHFGRQPRRSELAAAPSVISQSPYNRRFGSWTAALAAFTRYANASGTEAPASQEIIGTSPSYSANQPGSRQKRVGHSCPTRCFQHGFRTEMPGVGGLRDMAVAGAQAPQITARRVGSSEPDC
jgi:hypothetical protein